jgi:hypothetical protein
VLSDSVGMARAYSDDLRKKVLGAYASGEGTLRQLAERFDVSYGWVAKIHAAELATGHRSPNIWAGMFGRPSGGKGRRGCPSAASQAAGAKRSSPTATRSIDGWPVHITATSKKP